MVASAADQRAAVTCFGSPDYKCWGFGSPVPTPDEAVLRWPKGCQGFRFDLSRLSCFLLGLVPFPTAASGSSSSTALAS